LLSRELEFIISYEIAFKIVLELEKLREKKEKALQVKKISFLRKPLPFQERILKIFLIL